MKHFTPPAHHRTSSASSVDNATPGVEQRTSVRKSLNLVLARVTSGTDATLCRVRNISSQGLMIESAISFRREERVGIEFPGQSLAGTVAWHRDRFTGIRTFRPFCPDELVDGYALAECRVGWEHEFVTELGNALACAIVCSQSSNDVDCHRVRLRFSQALRAHLKYEDWVVYPALVKDTDPGIASTAAALWVEGQALDHLHNEYTRRWISTTIHEDWEGFGRETGELLQSLRRHIAEEDARLYRPLQLSRGERSLRMTSHVRTDGRFGPGDTLC